MLQIDEHMDEVRIRQFASQVPHIPPKVRHLLDESLLWEEGPDYYHGQLAALAFSHQLIAGAEQQAVIACAMAVIAEHIVKKGWW